MLRWLLIIVILAISFMSQALAVVVTLQNDGSNNNQIEWIGPIRNCDNEKSIDDCLTKLVQNIKPLLLKVMEEAGYPDLNQIKIGTVKYDQAQGPFALNVINNNIKVSGVPNYSLMKLKFNTNENTMNMAYELPVLRVESNYKMSGKAFFFPIKGSGPMSIEIRGVKAEGKMTFYKTENENGEKVIQIKETILENFSVKDVNARIRGLFDGNPLLSGVAHYFLNNYGPEVFEILRPIISKDTQDIMTINTNQFLSKLPELSQYIPDN